MTLRGIVVAFQFWLRDGDRHWAKVLTAVQKFEDKLRQLKTFPLKGVILEVVIVKIPRKPEHELILNSTHQINKGRRDEDDEDKDGAGQGSSERLETKRPYAEARRKMVQKAREEMRRHRQRR